MLATTMAQGELGDRIDIVLGDRVCSAPGRMGASGAQPDQISAQAIDPRGKAAFGDLSQRGIVEGNIR